jgi:hypothetical protein
MNNAELAKAINESGFPLQLGLKLLAHDGDWRVALSEHAWRDPNSDDPKFIDLVLRGRGDGPQRLVIECKRARDTEWIFLRDTTDYAERDSRLRVRARIAAMVPQTNTRIEDWADIPFIPGSPEANFCVIRKNNQRSQELLEKMAAEIVRATDALARQEYQIYERTRMQIVSINQGLSRIYVPMIVTTAALFVCDADYEGVDLETGEVADLTKSVEVPAVRFMKAFDAGDPRQSSAASVGRFSDQSERTVVVIQAGAFVNLLKKWDIGTNAPHHILDAMFPDGS